MGVVLDSFEESIALWHISCWGSSGYDSILIPSGIESMTIKYRLTSDILVMVCHLTKLAIFGSDAETWSTMAECCSC
jgi:hypothetical protein